MSKFDSKVIGYISLFDKLNLFCSGDACVVAGSEKAMQEYIQRANPENKDDLKLKKARFKEIVAGLLAGGAYAFDKESYGRFQPMAIQDGHDLSKVNFEDYSNQSDDLLIIRLNEI
ncbi:MAG: hypothetical protein HOC09_18095 [Deltaproteobacteria bacterium]|nr:hypothetical protein [Deltaproteobacteria bacterium]